MDFDLWSARGLVQALVIPFVMLAAARNRDWKIDLAVSREVVFQSTALAASGVYLLAVAAAGYYVRYFGGTWGKTIQIALLFGAALLLGFLFSSGTLRARLRVLINKHFFSYRYDYREEWLRFTRLLSMSDSGLGLQQRCVKALADLVESPAGSLWLERGEAYWQACTWNAPAVPYTEPRAGALIGYLRRTGWVVDLEERRAHPGRYPNLQPPAWLAADRDAWLVVPLATGERLLGFVVLQTPRAKIDVNWEVRDVLKTAALQAASFLAQVQASEALLEARKFEAFNRMSAFVVHDLKNLVAQLSLLLRNAQRHADNPEFRKDMLATVEHVVERMNHLLLQLRSGTAPIENARPVRLAPLVQRVVAGKQAQGRSIGCDASGDVVALGHEDRLERVLGHLVQNALEATAGGGEVQVRLAEEAERALIEVKDSGIGMSAEFVRDRLFKPFSTTKRSGMGIGAYESERYVAELGGEIRVDSAPGAGTMIQVLLPRAGLTAAAEHGAIA
jgi:putative PEP-CTERM system histidine kinase